MSSFNVFAEPELCTVAGFPIPKFGSVTEEEKECLRQRELAAADTITPLINLVKRIAAEQGITQKEAIQMVESAESSKENLGMLVEYLSELQALRNPGQARESEKRDYAALLLQSRLEPEWVFENLEKFKKYRRINLVLEDVLKIRTLPEEKWVSDETRKGIIGSIINRLPEQGINELANFFVQEHNQWVDYASDVLPQTEDSDFVGKSLNSTKPDGGKSKRKGTSSNEPITVSKPPE